MKALKIIFSLMLAFGFFNCLDAQTDSMRVHGNKLSCCMSPGIGICARGVVTGFAYTFLNSSNWGGNLIFKINPYKAEEMPDDFMEENVPWITPRDFVNSISLNAVKEFPVSSGKLRIGIEAGPSLVIYNHVNFEINPDYSSRDEGYPENKYVSERKLNAAPGASCSANVKYLTGFGGLQVSLFADINKLKPVYGLELYINLACNKGD